MTSTFHTHKPAATQRKTDWLSDRAADRRLAKYGLKASVSRPKKCHCETGRCTHEISTDETNIYVCSSLCTWLAISVSLHKSFLKSSWLSFLLFLYVHVVKCSRVLRHEHSVSVWLQGHFFTLITTFFSEKHLRVVCWDIATLHCDIRLHLKLTFSNVSTISCISFISWVLASINQCHRYTHRA